MFRHKDVNAILIFHPENNTQVRQLVNTGIEITRNSRNSPVLADSSESLKVDARQINVYVKSSRLWGGNVESANRSECVTEFL